MQKYPAISDYGIVGDGRTAALIDRQGSVDWLCFPSFYASSVFGALLDRRRGGHFSIAMLNADYTTRTYRGDTAVLETWFHGVDGVLKLTDCLPVYADDGAAHPLEPQRELLRCLEVVSGNPQVEVRFAPRLDYGRRRASPQRVGPGQWRMRETNELLYLHTDIALEPDGEGDLYGRATLTAGEPRYVSLSYTKGDIAVLPPLGDAATDRLADTVRWWEEWSGRCRYRGLYREPVLRSAITLKLLDYALSGAVLAAATTSLPENIGGSRNWDYRFCWLRDAGFTFRSFMELGYTGEAAAFIEWLLHSTRLTWPELQVMYAVHGEPDIKEVELDHLEGYRGSRPVRIGNEAQDQLQLDVYGEVVLAVHDYVLSGGRLDYSEARMLRGLGETVCRRWREADEGIWEIRDNPRHYTYSKLMCWVALDRLIALHDNDALTIPRAQFADVRHAIAQAIETRGFNERIGSYVGFFEGDQPDASLLLMARRGYIDARHPRMEGTFRFHERELGENGWIYRYGSDYDPLPEGEGAFVACSFWAVDCLIEQGRSQEAQERFEHLLEFRNDLGLYAEEIEPLTGTFCGNFPQAYSHVALIDTALNLHKGHTGKELD